MDDTPETMKLCQDGRLSQTCPSCGRDEAAGWYCTGCARPTGPAEWYRPAASAGRLESAAKGRVSRTATAAAKRQRRVA